MKKWIADLEGEIKHRLATLPDQSPYVEKRTLEVFEECLCDTRYMLMANALQLISCVDHHRYPLAAEKFRDKIGEWKREFYEKSDNNDFELFVRDILWTSIESLASRTPYVDLQRFDFE